jgi:outer membrane protein assembly factor BamA
VYELAKVTVEGETPVAPEALLKAGDFKTGDVANMERVSQGVERIAKAVRRAGYMEAKASSERRLDDGNHRVDVVVRVDSGPQFTMGKLEIKGLDLHGEAEVKRIWGLKEGKPFNPEYPEAFFNSIREQALFDNLGKTKADVKVNPKDRTVDVTLNFLKDDPQKTMPGLPGRGRGALLTGIPQGLQRQAR